MYIGYYWRFGLGRICIKLFLTQVCKSFTFLFIEGVDWGSFMKERDYIRKYNAMMQNNSLINFGVT